MGFVVPGEREGMGVAIDGVGDGDHLVEIGGQAGELGEIGFGHRTGGLAVVKIRAIWIVVQGGARAAQSEVASRCAGSLGVLGGVAF